MVKRSIALCDEKIICIESLYRVVDGEQINNPEMLDFLRTKGRAKKLLCPCQCGKHLMLVAGPKTTRSQHFREYPNEDIYNCVYSLEDEAVINSRINLKCWMDESFGTDDLELRTRLSDDNRTSLQDLPCSSISKKIAVKYYHDQVNLKEKEIEDLSRNSRGYKVIHIVGPNNYSNNGQYPEGLMKIQEIQSFVLILSSHGNKYELSELKAVIYVQTPKGLWKEITVVDNDLIKNYRIASDGRVLHNEESIYELSTKMLKEYEAKKSILTKQVDQYSNHSKALTKPSISLNMDEIRKKYLVDEQNMHEERRRLESDDRSRRIF